MVFLSIRAVACGNGGGYLTDFVRGDRRPAFRQDFLQSVGERLPGCRGLKVLRHIFSGLRHIGQMVLFHVTAEAFHDVVHQGLYIVLGNAGGGDLVQLLLHCLPQDLLHFFGS